MTDNNSTAETAPATPEDTAAADNPDAAETSPQDEPGDADVAPDAAEVDTDADDQGDADTFPRHVVEKLRKENAGLRDRAKTAENRLAALQRQQIDAQAAAAGLKPAALRAVVNDEDLLGEDGSVDAAKFAEAVKTARETLGLERRQPDRSRIGVSGIGLQGQRQPQGFASAFRRRD
ncbi:hypothetical protein ABQE44_25355 [Mycolicibacterium sp. XJ2546]